MHEKATTDRPIRGRQRFFIVVAGVIVIAVVAAVGLVLMLVR
jgi:type IV secretory pathway component VirB8